MTGKEDKIEKLKAQIQQNIIGFDTKIKKLVGAKNYAQFLLSKIKKAEKYKDGT